ncbi:MAG: hypothetical protein K0R84_2378 [Clostridia bacterium]|nr:hypothetical protein [Clostridia bacterium]
MDSIQYIEQRRNRTKQRLIIRLGVLQMIHKPLLNILLMPIAVLTVLIWKEKDRLFMIIEVPQVLFPIYKYSIGIIAAIIPMLIILALIDFVGNATARKDECDLQEAFDSQDLRNGCPILMNKKRIKGSDVTIREFYSSIPLKTWVERQEDIPDSMNVPFVEKLKYGGKSNGKRIVMYTATEREATARGKLYDDEF